MTVKGRNFALCCTTEATKEQLTSFFKISLEGPKNYGQEIRPCLVLVSGLQKPLNNPAEYANDWISSPILGQSIQECSAIVKSIAQLKGSDIDSEVFAVLDSESFKSRTIFFVEKADEDNEPIIGKGWWHIAQSTMGPIQIAKPDLGELIDEAKHKGGVIDFEYPDP